MASAWAALYQNALRSADAQLLEHSLVAIIAMHARLHAIGFPAEAADKREQSALFLALSDLRVLRNAFRRINGSDDAPDSGPPAV